MRLPKNVRAGNDFAHGCVQGSVDAWLLGLASVIVSLRDVRAGIKGD